MARGIAVVGLAVLLFGFPFSIEGQAPAAKEVTFTKDVAPILFENCVYCHRPNDIAPFSLLSYEDAQTWADDIKRVVTDKIMPPWKPVAGYGEFRDINVLSDEERQMIVNWVDAGAPLGDPAEIPTPTVSASEWKLG